MAFDIQENLKKLPDCPGVYIHKDRLGNVIYVGKAISLRNRVRQYFQSQKNMPAKVRSMVSQIAEFEYITAASEMEALILECNLIKKHRPKYNILLRDDKTYPYIKVTNDQYPRVLKTRLLTRDGGRYYGPYSDAGAVNKIVDLLNASFCLKRCSAVAFPQGFKPCLNYHINQCRGICTGLVSEEEYSRAVEGAVEFLSGHDKTLIRTLKEKMDAASEAMDYEEAAVYRDYIEAAKALSETQRVVIHHSREADIVVPIMDKFIAVFTVRDGKLIGRESYELDNVDMEMRQRGQSPLSQKSASADVISEFIKQHYSELPNVPKEILVAEMPEDGELLAQYLTKEAGHRVEILRPQRGEKKALLDLALKDAVEMAKTIEERAEAARDRKETLGREIHEVLCEMEFGRDTLEAGGLPEYDGRQFRCEAYDISNTNGVDTVGAMVVYEGLKPDRQSYRKFKVRSVTGQDDYACMQEVLSRRFTRVFRGDEKFTVLPDIIFMDGGKGHVSAALEVMDVTGFNIPVVGMVKDENHRTRALVYRIMRQKGQSPLSQNGEQYEWHEIELKDKPLLFRYIGRMQEEVHRFAITYHRKVRDKSAIRSVLDEIPGIGPKRRQALLEHFKSVDRIRAASLEELEAAPSMDARSARNVFDFFRLK